MAKYQVFLTKTVKKQLDRLPDNISDPLLDTIVTLGNNPRPAGYKKLKNRNGYRIRKGDYRIIFDIFDKVLTIDIIAVGHRKDIY
ncbi:MAG: type II toxin-antitoxin system RelE/ParE family toxin [Bacteroidetes bacterium]|nr:type II toxin-antitoxin system RelE/ParE family toxin [Bacteroidota bacterium]